MNTTAIDPLFDPSSSEYVKNPYPTYKKLREQDPIHLSPLGFWIVTRYEDVNSILKDSRFGQDIDHLLLKKYGYDKSVLKEPSSIVLSNLIIMKNPPDHTRIRKLIVKAFTPQCVEEALPTIKKTANALIDKVENQRHMDIIKDYAFLLPANVICEMMGIPEEGRDHFLSGLHPPTALLRPTPLSAKEMELANKDILYVKRYIQSLLEDRRKNPREDLITALIEAKDDQEQLSEEELIATIGFLFFAGHETTKNLIGNGFLALHQFPDQLEKLKKNPSLMPNAIEEFLRFEAPSQMSSPRIALENASIRDVPVKKGDLVLCVQGSANRDPQVFSDPDRLDITRQNIKHFSFGGGMHFCLGSQLARIEGGVAIQTLLDRLPSLKIEKMDELQWEKSYNHRSLTALPVSWQ